MHYEGEDKSPDLATFNSRGGREGFPTVLAIRAMGDRRVVDPPGICWAAYSDSALLQSIKTIASVLQARAEERAAAGAPQTWDAIADIPAAVPRGETKPSGSDAQKVEKPVQEWY